MTALKTPSPELLGPILTTTQLEQITGLATTLSPEQAIWASGYFAGLSQQAPTNLLTPDAGLDPRLPSQEAPATASATQVTTILFASETGNSKDLASSLAEAAANRGVETKLTDMADYKVRSLKEERDLLIIASTHGEGDPPQTTLDFFEFLESRKAPKLPQLRFAVLALGDSTYEQYCGAGRRVDERLAELGGERLADRVECDVDYEDDAAAWIEAMVGELVSSQPTSNGSAPAAVASVASTNGFAAPTAFSKKNPFQSAVIENLVLTGRGSTKETRHLELSLEDSGLVYQPGDALGVVPQNDPALVTTLLESLSLPADAEVSVKKETTNLSAALTGNFEITAATPRFLEHWAELADSAELRSLGGADQAKERTAFLGTHHILDIVRDFPVPGIDPEQFTAGLRPLQPRLYSIASSLTAAPDEVHLTVSTVRYSLHDLARTGVASGYLAELTDEEATVPVYIQANDHFHLPDDETPILMIGAGTGVAPYRAFMQEREERGASGGSWLFFGERNFHSDFLYQVEWQAQLKSGALSRLDLAFSRDSSDKVYVQNRLRQQGRDVYSWLEDGASVYVCGDSANMAPDVEAALVDLISEHSGLGDDGARDYLAEMRRDRRYLLDVY